MNSNSLANIKIVLRKVINIINHSKKILLNIMLCQKFNFLKEKINVFLHRLTAIMLSKPLTFCLELFFLELL